MGMPSTSLFGSSYICQGDGFDVDEKLQVAAEPPWQRHEYGEWLKKYDCVFTFAVRANPS